MHYILTGTFSSSKKMGDCRDPQTNQNKKPGQWHHVQKAKLRTDTESGTMHDLMVQHFNIKVAAQEYDLLRKMEAYVFCDFKNLEFSQSADLNLINRRSALHFGQRGMLTANSSLGTTQYKSNIKACSKMAQLFQRMAYRFGLAKRRVKVSTLNTGLFAIRSASDNSRIARFPTILSCRRGD